MSEETEGVTGLRRRILEAVATAGVGSGLAGCLGGTGDSSTPTETPDGRSRETPSETPGTPTETPDPEDVPDRFLGRGPRVGLETVATGVDLPTDFASVGGDSDRLFVTDQTGEIYDVDLSKSGPLHLDDQDPFLDLSGQVVVGDETGLLGLAFHPEFATNGRLFVRYSSPSGEDTPDRYEHVERFSEFLATDDRRGADPGSERVLLSIPQPTPYHNSGDVLFGPDGYCYLTTGDGGGWEDGEQDWSPLAPQQAGSSQTTTDDLRGGVLRIDVDERSSSGSRTGSNDLDAETENCPYGIPPDNPLVDREGHRDEFYAWGLRNPWGASFDGGDLYVADVGAALFESVYRVEKGGNYGWAVKEGTHCFNPGEWSDPFDTCPQWTPDDVRGGERLRDPIVEYPHEHDDEDGAVGMAVVGGNVYQGSELPQLQGQYVFGDLAGRLLVSSPPGEEILHPYYRKRDLWPIRKLDERYLDDRRGGIPTWDVNVPVVGTGPDGELYVGTTPFKGDDPGEVLRVTTPGER